MIIMAKTMQCVRWIVKLTLFCGQFWNIKQYRLVLGPNKLYNNQILKYRSTALAFKYYENVSLHKLQNELKYSSLGLTKLSKIFIELLLFVQYTEYSICN